MDARVRRSIHEPIRKGLNRSELWDREDRGLIWCWELGRQKRLQDPDLAARAENGELVMLAWKGGVQKQTKVDRKSGSLYYLATRQGLRGEDLDIALEDELTLVCTKTGQVVVYSASIRKDEDSEPEVNLSSAED